MNVADILTKHGADQDAHTKVKPITVDVGTGSDLNRVIPSSPHSCQPKSKSPPLQMAILI